MYDEKIMAEATRKAVQMFDWLINLFVAKKTGNRAVLVGINKYPGAPLSGCVNDVNDVKAFLMNKYGFEKGDFKILTDKQATAANIKEALKWLAQTPSGKIAYFHYSGHGAQVPAGNFFEPDGLLEVICPVDFDWTAPHMITDKQFVEIFKAMAPGVRFNWGSDSCHSGDLDRMITGTPKAFPMNSAIKWSLARAKRRNAKVCAREMVGGMINVGYLSGCKSEQTSADAYIDGRHCGAMTYFMLKVLREKPGLTLSEVAVEMRRRLALNGYSQEPQSEGPRAGLPFLK